MIRLLALALLLALPITSPLSAQHIRTNLVVSAKGRKGTLHLYRFNSKDVQLKIIPREKYRNLAAAMTSNQCLAGCNGGFFDPEYKPLGQEISDGKIRGHRNLASSLASGVFYQDHKGLHLERAKTFYQKERPTPKQLLQTGPFLVEKGKAVSGLSQSRAARRTFIATDGLGNWIIAYTPATTLAQLAKSLANSKEHYGFQIQTALNLDGGSSSALWVQQGKKSPLYLREFKPVANYIGFVKK